MICKAKFAPSADFFCLRHPWPPERVRTLQMVSEAGGAETFYFPTKKQIPSGATLLFLEGIPSAKEAWIIKVGLHNCTVIIKNHESSWLMHSPKISSIQNGGRYAHESSNNGKDRHQYLLNLFKKRLTNNDHSGDGDGDISTSCADVWWAPTSMSVKLSSKGSF